ncbi:MAG: M6 family metalloprotease domain-containing protein [Clostridia bacterium]|nr:M6 family metalloprotease domain-containing protein [Clostridia bacterium]
MKRSLAFILIVAMLAVLTLSQTWAQTPVAQTGAARLTMPDYQKVDSELSKELRASNKSIKGKNLKLSGKAYIKPSEGQALEPLDVRTDSARGIAILIDFPLGTDGKSAVPGVNYAPVPSAKFNDLLNGSSYNPYDIEPFKWLAQYNGVNAPTDRTLRNYYNEVSYGQYRIQVDVAGWYTLPKPYSYYLGQDQGYYNENGDAHIAELVWDAIQAADKDVDFSKYAVDGVVPNIFIIHRGTGAEYNMDPSIIWSHKWDIVSATYYGYLYRTGEELSDEALEAQYQTQKVDGVYVNTYNIVPEVGQDITGYLKYVYPDLFGPDYKGRAPSPAYVGVYAHEFGHILGLPDQYDYGYESEGTGVFTLMASGSYGRNINNRWYSGNTPVNLNAWDKTYLGFVKPAVITKTQSVTLRPANESQDIYKIVVPGSMGREYFLLENRQQRGYDVGLSYNIDGTALHGLVVYHIVDDMIQKSFHRPNEAENWDSNHLGLAQQGLSQYGQSHYGFSVIQADGLYNLEHGINDGDAGDVFPGKFGITSLSAKGSSGANTTSVFKWDNKSTETGISLQNIVESPDGTVSLKVVLK